MVVGESTTNPRVSSVDFLHASEREHADAKTNREKDSDLFSVLEETLEEERARLMLANSILGCAQAALDPEAVSVAPPVYFPEVLEQVRQLINTSVRRLEYEEVRRVLHRWMGGAH